jgi:pyrimidine-specific ribonucleoside hydrolase
VRVGFRELHGHARRAGRTEEHEDLPAHLHDHVVLPRPVLERLRQREREREHLLTHGGHGSPTILRRVQIPTILDCDPGHDDAIALLLALASPELELLAVTTTYGNQTLAKTTANALRVLELVGRTDVPVGAGAKGPLVRELVIAAHVHGESGLDGPALPEPTTCVASDDAVEFMADRIASSAGAVTLVATGPLTNVARYLQERATDGIERIVLMGGAIAEGNFTPAAEFNIWCDPEAAEIVFESGLDVSMMGLDVTHQALLGTAVEERLRAAGHVGAFVADLNVFFTRYHRETYGWEGAPIHDAVAVAYVVRPELVETQDRNVTVELESDLCRGRTVVDLWRRTERAPNAHVGVRLDADAFFDLLAERIASLG